MTKGHFTVVQIGANDGMIHDPINKFIKRDGWHGVLLEPQRSIHDQYLQKVYARQQGIETVCAAIGAEDGYSTLYKIGWCDMRWASGLATFQKAVLQQAYDSGLVARAARKHGLTVPQDTSIHIAEERVRVVTPATLLKEYQLSDISLLMIDTEGYDYEVIKLFDVATTKPRAIIYENIHLSAMDRQACESHLSSLGYYIVQYDANTVAILQELWDNLSLHS